MELQRRLGNAAAAEETGARQRLEALVQHGECFGRGGAETRPHRGVDAVERDGEERGVLDRETAKDEGRLHEVAVRAIGRRQRLDSLS